MSLSCPSSVYVKDVLQLFHEQCDEALVLLVPVRLGSETLNSIYIPCIQGLLSLDCCVGIIGGRPKHSVYFIWLPRWVCMSSIMCTFHFYIFMFYLLNHC